MSLESKCYVQQTVVVFANTNEVHYWKTIRPRPSLPAVQISTYIVFVGQCLKVSLSIPFLYFYVPLECTSVFAFSFISAQRALVIGRSYLPLAKIALSTLEHWSRAFPSSLLEPRYKDVLPLLDAYLKSVEDSGMICIFIIQLQFYLCFSTLFCTIAL